MVREQRPGLVLPVAAAVATLVAGLVLAPAPASAHDELTGTVPADGATVTTQLDEVTLTFSGVVRADGSTVTVTGPDGEVRSDGPVSVRDTVVHQAVTPLSSGAYRVQWNVVAGDGDRMTGELAFMLALPPELEPATSVSPTTPTSPPSTEPTTPAAVSDLVAEGGAGAGWWWVVAAVLVVALAVGVLLVWRRRGQP